MFEPTRPFMQRAVRGLVLCPIGDVVPDEASPMGWLLVDADDAVAGLFQKAHDLSPAAGVVPVLALSRALNPDADIGLGDRPRIVSKRDPRGDFGWIDTEHGSGCAMHGGKAKG